MGFRTEKKHIIDFIFPISLFFVFAATALVVIILAANIYSNTTKASSSSFETRTVLSYMTEKIHQNDENGSISIGAFDGLDALIIRQTYSEKPYVTYIYEYEGTLRELFIQDGIDASASSGKEIMKVNGFAMESISDHLFRFSCTSPEDVPTETVVAVKSVNPNR